MTRALSLLCLIAALMVVAAPAFAEPVPRSVAIKITDTGFEPKQVNAKVGEPITLTFTRTTDRTCITAIDIPDEDVKEFQVPLNKAVTLTITPKKKGIERFHCSAMGMGGGKIVVQ